MAGGSGTRFWPKSRRNRPKQLLRLSGDATMLQQTVARIAPLVPPERILIVTGADQAEAARAQLPELARGERRRRALPARHGAVRRPGRRDRRPGRPRRDDDRHAGRPRDRAGRDVPDDRPRGRLGHRRRPDAPSSPSASSRPAPRPATATSSAASRSGRRDGIALHRVVQFREKPDRATAERFLAAGRFAWNSGIFVWRARAILDALAEHRPALAAALDRIGAALGTPAEAETIAREYPADGAGPDRQGRHGEGPQRPRPRGRLRLERRRRLARPDRPRAPRRRTATRSRATSSPSRPRDSIIISDDGGLIATLGVDDLVIVQSGGATLVARKDQLDKLKALVEGLDKAGLGSTL